MCLLRGARREEAEQARRRDRHGQLRHRDRAGELPGRGRGRGPDRGRRRGRIHGGAAAAVPGRAPRARAEAGQRRGACRSAGGRGGWGARRPGGAATAPGRVAGPGRPGDGIRHGRPVPGLGVGLAGAGDPGRGLGRLALPPGGGAQRETRRRDHGHARQRRSHGRLPVVAVRAGVRLRADLPRSGGRGDHADPARALPRGTGQAQGGRCPACPAVAGREGGRTAARRARGTGARRATLPSATSSRSGPGRRSRPTASSSAEARRWTRQW